MAKNATINMRVDASLKTDVERILQALGISTTEAINMFLNRVRLSRGIPFSVQMTDDEFRRYLAECPLDDEAISPEEASSIKAALSEIKEGKVASFDEIKRSLGK
ncbi:MAG: type II toxin-antitoxin system RelB/DinJ family antitoxin [Desulfuromonadaceae bacterium]|nr:type II toxin-antitoxin system RelB/DinJ family antitoxin [Desulfuromonadaceae bacterium]